MDDIRLKNVGGGAPGGGEKWVAEDFGRLSAARLFG